ncbi:MAG: hypothetical protein ACT4PV_07980 [Planctomycetaceae bacterium]
MEVNCRECGAVLNVNPKLGGVTMRCPRCSAEIRLKASPEEEGGAAAPRASRRARAAPVAEPQKDGAPERPRPPPTLWLMLEQLVLLGLAGSCIAGAFFRDAWGPDPRSYFFEWPPALAGAGVFFLVLSVLARRLPLLMSLAAALGVLWACALHYGGARGLDASRTLALACSMLVVWLAIQHRRALR